jgi:hypothetical protein
MTDPYPALGSDYRPPIETYTTNRGLTLTAEQVVELKELLAHVPNPSDNIVKLYDVVSKL